MNSLHARLVGFMLLAVALAWGATALAVWREARHETAEILAQLPAAVRAELDADRDEIADEVAEHMAKPVLVAFPVLALLLLGAVSLALRPLRRLAGEVAARAPEHLSPLDAETVPGEVRPLIERLNRLFAAIDRALDNERRFTADAAHELRTPLAAIKAQAQVALAAAAPDEREHALRQIVAGCDRATRLATQLLTLARLDAPGAVTADDTVDLRALAAEVLSAAAATAVELGCPLALHEAASATATDVRGDPVLIAVALRNLVDNALRHTPPGTEVTVSVTRDGADTVVSVEDAGPGILAAERDMVQRRFGRGSDAGAGGSGLGLSIVQRIASLHRARFTLEPRVGTSGTAARLRFPSR